MGGPSRRQIEEDVSAIAGGVLGATGDDPLAATILPPGHRGLGVGRESGRLRRDGVSRHDDPHGSTRYLYSAEGQIVSGLQVVSRDGRTAVVANVYTRPDYRNLGLASRLLARARRDFSRVDHAEESHLSSAGVAWRDAVEGPGPSATRKRSGSGRPR